MPADQGLNHHRRCLGIGFVSVCVLAGGEREEEERGREWRGCGWVQNQQKLYSSTVECQIATECNNLTCCTNKCISFQEAWRVCCHVCCQRVFALRLHLYINRNCHLHAVLEHSTLHTSRLPFLDSGSDSAFGVECTSWSCSASCL